MGERGPIAKKMADANETGIRHRFRVWSGDTPHWAECTDGWKSKEFVGYNDAQRQFGEHHELQHGAK